MKLFFTFILCFFCFFANAQSKKEKKEAVKNLVIEFVENRNLVMEISQTVTAPIKGVNPRPAEFINFPIPYTVSLIDNSVIGNVPYQIKPHIHTTHFLNSWPFLELDNPVENLKITQGKKGYIISFLVKKVDYKMTPGLIAKDTEFGYANFDLEVKFNGIVSMVITSQFSPMTYSGVVRGIQ
jgi:hypothetical protein